ncbi:hypothetical protein INE86_03436 [Parabacteroides distasonis]|jgi:hypothetical protein|uniref:hypothetical protein n=1 Tax=Parabacteroides distasonis TaxID=823 RepID=UPI001BADE059|nr:hypothetical protein [Parabacteroides distasonis]QUT54895.1 hypothetical protein INE86_03436 [Parabacteroides distasonis]DAJ57648.1 MAG TPA: hypothetical protein [Caudoviricetes sp.]
MIRRDYHIKRYDWVIHVLYNVTCSRISDIIALLRRAGCPESKIREAYGNVGSCKLDVGLTYSNYRSRESVMVIGRTSSYREFSNSLFHECRHLTDHMAIALNMDVGGEEIAYLSGYIGGKLAPDIQLFICDCNCHKNEINRHIYQQKKRKENGNKSRFKN